MFTKRENKVRKEVDLSHIRPQALGSARQKSQFRLLAHLALPSLLAFTFQRTRALPLALPSSEGTRERGWERKREGEIGRTRESAGERWSEGARERRRDRDVDWERERRGGWRGGGAVGQRRTWHTRQTSSATQKPWLNSPGM
jgi:hypothetical protein